MHRARRLLSRSLQIALAFSISSTLPLGAQAAARFEPGPCPFEGGAWLEGENLDCGTLVVPESRDRPGGRTLRLAVAILRSSADEPRPDPVVWLSGGPGFAAVTFARSFSASPVVLAIRRERDFILWDQRGTGYSDPTFCPDQRARLLSLEYVGNDDPLRAALEIVSDCRERMLAEGLDFSAYNSVTNSHDLDALRHALGYERWNVFGGSYGARLALVAAREVPEGIRALILDATSPPNVGGGDHTAANLARSLDLVFRQCESSPSCRAQFPDLESEFYAAIDELNADPLTIPMADTSRFPTGHVVLDGRTFALGVFQALYSRYLIPLLPHVIHQMREGNVKLLVGLADALAPDPETQNPWLEYTVECYEQLPLLSVERPADVGAGDRLAVIADRLFEPVCGAWHSERGDTARLREPVTTDVPTLISVGEFDPITPPYYSRLVAEHLPNSLYLEVRGMGHGALPFTACTRGILESFLDAPATMPDTACLGELPGVVFVTDLHIEPAIGAVAQELAAGPGLGLILWLGATLLLLVSAVLGWPAVALVRRIRRRPAPPRDARRLARPLAGLAALTAVGFVVGLAWVIRRVAAQNPYVIGFGIPESAAPLLWLPWAVVASTLGAVAFAVLAWRRGWWGRAGRVHYSLVAAACVAFTAFLVTRGLL